MGSDVFVYFTKDGGTQASTAELDELAADSGSADTGASAETITARLDAASNVREASEAELWADGAAIHVFDPATGRNLSVAANAGTPIPTIARPAAAAPVADVATESRTETEGSTTDLP
jgi:multiple sugar transport system ATP-binding protein